MSTYISGPIAGHADPGEAFASAQRRLALRGCGEVVNPYLVDPVDHDGPCPPGYGPGTDDAAHTSSACYMRTDLRALLDCDSIYMLTGWERSRGARVEWAVAVACGMTVEYEAQA